MKTLRAAFRSQDMHILLSPAQHGTQEVTIIM